MASARQINGRWYYRINIISKIREKSLIGGYIVYNNQVYKNQIKRAIMAYFWPNRTNM